VRKRQLKALGLNAFVNQQIEVKRSRSVDDGAKPADARLYPQARAEQRVGRKLGFYKQHRVVKNRLLGVSDGVGFVDL